MNFLGLDPKCHIIQWINQKENVKIKKKEIIRLCLHSIIETYDIYGYLAYSYSWNFDRFFDRCSDWNGNHQYYGITKFLVDKFHKEGAHPRKALEEYLDGKNMFDLWKEHRSHKFYYYMQKQKGFKGPKQYSKRLKRELKEEIEYRLSLRKDRVLEQLKLHPKYVAKCIDNIGMEAYFNSIEVM